jgi:hypothetical protein
MNYEINYNDQIFKKNFILSKTKVCVKSDSLKNYLKLDDVGLKKFYKKIL